MGKALAMVLLLITLPVATSCTAVYAQATGPQLYARASFDLNCPEDKLDYTTIDSKTVGVRGCGKQATYIESCTGPRRDVRTECSWVLNSPMKPTSPTKRY